MYDKTIISTITIKTISFGNLTRSHTIILGIFIIACIASWKEKFINYGIFS
jgi:hypothetical protein